MKVYIGPYPKSPMDLDWLFDPLRKILPEKTVDFVELKAYNIINRFRPPRKVKTKIRIDKYDTWSMDYTLGLIIIPMLKQLKETKHGAPYVDDKDVPKELRSTSAPKKENAWDLDDNFFKRWEWVMDEMIFAFEHTVNDDWQYKTDDDKEYKKIDKRVKNGLRLFGVYYRGLWD